jgi:CheY-like chemotaxis protein
MTDAHAFLAGKRCLVLEDEFLIALDIQQALEAAGASVTCVGDAEQALKALHEGAKFDFAVLDFKLSGRTRNSMTVAALLAEQGTPFVFLTGMRVDDVQGQSFPNVPVVEKPYLVETLMEALRKVLGVNDEPDRAA